jgi:hypothetical protein
MMQAILHIGDMKCGSKSIQTWLAQDAAILREHGFHRCQAIQWGCYDSGLASYALNDDRRETTPRHEFGIGSAAEVPAHRREIEERLAHAMANLPSDARGMIFSHEMLLSLEPAEVERAVALIRRHFDSIRVVAYIRRQDRLFLSLWGQRLKTHDPGSAFCDTMRTHRRYLPMLDAWEGAVGREHVTLRVFDKATFRKGDLRADFCEAAGIPLDPRFTRPALRNEGLDAAAQLLLLELCDRLNARRERDRRSLGRRLRRVLFGRESRDWIPVAFPGSLVRHLMRTRQGKGLLPSRQWARETAAAHVEENETIRRRHFPDRERLFDDDFSSYPEAGGPPGVGLRECDPEAFVTTDREPLTPEAITEACEAVLGRRPGTGEEASLGRSATNLAHLYALLLERTRSTWGRASCPPKARPEAA